jgi:tannase/feruloyl esterase
MRTRRCGSIVVGVLAALAVAAPAAAQNLHSFIDAAKSPLNYSKATVKPQIPCPDVRSLATGGVSITAVEIVAVAEGVPEHCRVTGTIAPEIHFEVNLPAAWNRRFYMSGNGGFAGEVSDIPPRAAVRAAALRQGFVTATTNTGHDATKEALASFARDPQKVTDYAFRAVHLVALTAKGIATRYYDRPVAYSYWDGCSTGGRQALISAQRFPGDFDGIVAGAPVLNFVDTNVTGLWNARAVADGPLTLDTLKVAADVVYAKCGGADGVIDDPRRCSFDPTRDLPKCAGASGSGCVTESQARALKQIYGGVVKDGKPYFPGQPVGAEKAGSSPFGEPRALSGWDRWLIGRDGGPSLQLAFGESFMRYMAFGKPDPSYDWTTFDFDKDPDRMGDIRRLLNATDPDLSRFRSRGGKLLMYFGWADAALTPFMAIDYYEKALATNGPDTRDFFRFFLVPGMFHCRGGIGTDRFDAMTAVINWVEGGTAPDSIPAARVEQDRVKRTRPLCPYPRVARYKGSGSIDDGANFACADP